MFQRPGTRIDAKPAGCSIPEWHSGLYMGRVMHARLKPVRHRLDYGVFSLLLDLDELSVLSDRLKFFGYNRSGVLSFHDKDHGPRDGKPLRPWVEAQLARRDIHLQGGAIRLLCFPRLWGYAFNPLSVYFCYDATSRLAAILYEVSNTFGEWHCYLLVPQAGTDGGDTVSHGTDKAFHVSPFIGMDCRYRFKVKPPGDRLRILIRQSDAEGDALLIASHLAERRELSDRTLCAAVLRYPLMTVKIMAAIHWEALKLWIKGARYHRKPAPPGESVSW